MFWPILQLFQLLECVSDPVDFVDTDIGTLPIPQVNVVPLPESYFPTSPFKLVPQRKEYVDWTIEGLPLYINRDTNKQLLRMFPFTNKDHLLNLNKSLPKFTYDNEKYLPYMYSVYLNDEDVFVQYGFQNDSIVFYVDFKPEDTPYLMFTSVESDVYSIGNRGATTTFGGYVAMIDLDTPAERHGSPIMDGFRVNAHPFNMSSKVLFQFPKGTTRIRGKLSIHDNPVRRHPTAEDNQQQQDQYLIDPLIENGRKAWNDYLNKIEVDGTSTADLTLFYTALYRLRSKQSFWISSLFNSSSAHNSNEESYSDCNHLFSSVLHTSVPNGDFSSYFKSLNITSKSSLLSAAVSNPNLTTCFGSNEDLSSALDEALSHRELNPDFEFLTKLPSHRYQNIGPSSYLKDAPSVEKLYFQSNEDYKASLEIHRRIRQQFRPDLMGLRRDYTGANSYIDVVLTALGFAKNGNNLNLIGPWFHTITIRGDTEFKIVAPGAGKDCKYVKSATLDGKKLTSLSIPAKAIFTNGTLELEMSCVPPK